MTDTLTDIGAGLVVGGLTVSAVWGFFWLAIGLIGWRRGTCGWGIVMKGLAGGFIPLSLVIGLSWWRVGGGSDELWFMSGLVGVPALLLALSLRSMPDGRTAGTHLLEGVRSLRADLLGAHQGCAGCPHGRDHETYR